MSTHLCEVLIRDTKETLVFYEIEVEDKDHHPIDPTWYLARRQAVRRFEKELQHTSSLKKKLNGRDWCVDSVVM